MFTANSVSAKLKDSNDPDQYDTPSTGILQLAHNLYIPTEANTAYQVAW